MQWLKKYATAKMNYSSLCKYYDKWLSTKLFISLNIAILAKKFDYNLFYCKMFMLYFRSVKANVFNTHGGSKLQKSKSITLILA